MNGELTTADGRRIKLRAPTGNEFPSRGFESGKETFVSPPDDGSGVEIKIDAHSKRLQLLKSFPKYAKLPN